MTTKNSKLKMTVHLVIEMERDDGWIRPEDRYLFPSKALAEEFVAAYRKAKPPSGSWYLYQEYSGTTEVTEEQFDKYRYKGDLISMPEWNFVGF